MASALCVHSGFLQRIRLAFTSPINYLKQTIGTEIVRLVEDIKQKHAEEVARLDGEHAKKVFSLEKQLEEYKLLVESHGNLSNSTLVVSTDEDQPNSDGVNTENNQTPNTLAQSMISKGREILKDDQNCEDESDVLSAKRCQEELIDDSEIQKSGKTIDEEVDNQHACQKNGSCDNSQRHCILETCAHTGTVPFESEKVLNERKDQERQACIDDCEMSTYIQEIESLSLNLSSVRDERDELKKLVAELRGQIEDLKIKNTSILETRHVNQRRVRFFEEEKKIDNNEKDDFDDIAMTFGENVEQNQIIRGINPIQKNHFDTPSGQNHPVTVSPDPSPKKTLSRQSSIQKANFLHVSMSQQNAQVDGICKDLIEFIDELKKDLKLEDPSDKQKLSTHC